MNLTFIRSATKSRLFKIILLAALACSFLFVFVISPHKFIPTHKLYYFFEHPLLSDLGVYISSARNSLMKVGNIIHFLYWFKDTNLPELQIVINADDFLAMEDALPEKKLSGLLEEENKKFVDAIFKSENYTEDVKIRYRGLHPVHWSGSKRSLLIKFPEENLFWNMKAVDLIVPEDRSYFGELLNTKRIKRENLATTKMLFVRLAVNGKDAGVYLAKERVSSAWLELSKIPATSEVFSQTNSLNSGKFSELPQWNKNIHEEDTSYDALETLLLIFDYERVNKEEFSKLIENIFDLQKWYSAISISVLASSSHAHTGNLNFLFNSATGKFEPLLEDINISAPDLRPGKEIYDLFMANPLTRYVLSTPAVYQKYITVLAEMAKDSNLQKDLEYYDSLTDNVTAEFYKDQTKSRGDLYFSNSIKEMRDFIKGNYKRAQDLLSIDEPPFSRVDAMNAIVEPNFTLGNIKNNFRPQFPGSFKYLYDVVRHVDNDIVLSGKQIIRQNLIIPQNTKLIIRPGTKIYLAEGVSLISYSPIEALGTKNNPILIARIDPDKNWGAVSVINTDEKSEFNYVTMIGGSSSEEINGVTFTGMLSAHNAPLYVYNSNFHQDGDDDAINVKYATGEIMDSKFFDMNQDAIDLDFTENFIVSGNIFSNIGIGESGDAVDLSFGNNTIISRNKINTCSDKGVSVGERSRPHIYENTIKNCLMGIAVKDESYARIHDNVFSGNDQDISLYIKKQIFGEPSAEIFDNVYNN